MLTLKGLSIGVIDLVVISWDNLLALLNLVSPKLQPGHVVPEGCPGHDKRWPAYVPPSSSDSRSPCPMVNALANHGILPHDGKNIAFTDLHAMVRKCFNFAPSFSFFASQFAANFMNKSYWKDHFDLADLSLHANNAIEHDASLTRQDVALVPDQGKPDQELVQELLQQATGKAKDGSAQLTPADLSKALSKRRAEAKKTNPEYSETRFHNFFGSAKYDVFH